MVNNSPADSKNKYGPILLVLFAVGVVYCGFHVTTEPFYNNDETRHVMTGVFFRDLLHDMPLRHLRAYAINYYLQYPALGLLIWPPFFYIMEGIVMSIVGTSMLVPTVLVWVFAGLAFTYLFFLVRRYYDTSRAAVATFLLAFCPLVFNLSHHIMLEVPTLALSLAAIYHYVRYLDLDVRRDLLLAGLAASLAALTRFDAAQLLPLFLILLISKSRLRILLRKDVITIAGCALLLVVPVYALSASGVGWVHLKSVTDTSSSDVPALLSLRRLWFYPSLLPSQLGWVPLIAAMVGLGGSLSRIERAKSSVFLAMIAVTYVIFTPIGETESRHAIYWLPAFSLFAAHGIFLVAKNLRAPRLFVPIAAMIVALAASSTLAIPQTYLRGYEKSAAYVKANTGSSRYCFFDGRLDGDFIYQIRTHDPGRKLWVLRADKLLFNVLEGAVKDPSGATPGEQEIIDTIFKYDPELIVAERPEVLDQSNQFERVHSGFEANVRNVIVKHPERFALEKEFKVQSNDSVFRGITLQVFRNTFRNPNPDHHLEIENMMLKKSLQTDVP